MSALFAALYAVGCIVVALAAGLGVRALERWRRNRREVRRAMRGIVTDHRPVISAKPNSLWGKERP